MALDASNAFNLVNRNITLGVIYKKLPSLHLAAYNAYGKKSYTVMEDSAIPVEQGGSQGCPLAGTFFNIGLSLLVDKVISNLNGSNSGRHAWLMDDGFFAGSKEDALIFCETVKSLGPEIGYIVNEKSKVFGLDSSHKVF